MPRGRTHYQILGLTRDASSIDIASAVRDKLAELKGEPGSEGQADEVREAYQVLANPHSRAEYDAGLPPDRAQLAARQAASRGPGPIAFVMEVLREAGVVKVGIGAVVLAMATIIWFKTRPPKPPPPQIVEISRTIVPQLPVRAEAPPASAPAPATEATSVSGPPSASGSMNAEDVFRAVSGSVARIQVTDSSGRLISQGSGVVIGSTLVITNCHVVADAFDITVKVGGTVLQGVVQVADKEFDLCSLRVTGLSAPLAKFGTGDVRVGQPVYAIGAPQGLELTLSEGIVSSLRETTRGTLIQTTAPISPGSSGGGLFNASGQLVGIVTFQHKTGQNLNFAVPATWIFEMQQREATEPVSAPVARSAGSPQ